MKLFYRRTFVCLLLAVAVMGCRHAESNPLELVPFGLGATSPVVTLTPRPASDASPTPGRTPQARPSPTATPVPPTPTPSPEIQIRNWQDAFTWQQNGDYDRAIQGYRVLLLRRPTEEDINTILFHLGETHLLDGDPVTADEVLSTYVVKVPDDAVAWFLLGRARQAIADWGGTMEAFQAYRQLDETLADYAGLSIADALRALDRRQEAAGEYEAAAEMTPDDALAATALETRAEIALAQSDSAAAAHWYAQAADRAPEVAQKARLLALAGSSYLSAGQLADAMHTLHRVIQDYRATGGAYMALGELLILGQPVNQRTQGLVYYYNGHYRLAVEALTRYLNEEPAPLGDSLYFLGRSYEGLGRWASAIEAYDRLIENYPGNQRYGAAWVRKARAQQRLGQTDLAVSTYRQFANEHPQDTLVDNALWEAARALETLGRRAEAADLYRVIVNQYPQGDVGDKASFRIGILPYLDEDYGAARVAWHLAAGRTRKAETRAQALLWAGKAALALSDAAAAAQDLAAAATAAPFSFDGLRARRLLGEQPFAEADEPTKDRPSLSRWLGVTETALIEIDRRLEADPRFQRGWMLLSVGMRDEGLAELKALRNAYWSRPTHLSRLAMLLDHPSSRHLSITSAERALTLTGTSPLEAPIEVVYLAYPAGYRDLIVQMSKQYGLDPRLLAALIRQESLFNPTATSYAKARGLTQVIPSTGEYIAGKLGIHDFDVTSLYRPYRSIQFGAWYLAQQMNSFGDPILALAAYNGGPGNSRRWQRLTNDIDMLVASIHLDQTRKYVRAVTEQHVLYRVLYDDKLQLR